MIAASGERQQFVVPAASFGNVRNVAPQGLSAAVGRYQASRGSDSRTPLVATVSNGWSLGSRSTLNAGVLVSARTAHWPPGFQSTPAMRSALRSACARPAPASRARSPGPADHGEPVGHAGRALVHEPVGHLADGRLSRPGAGGAGAAPGCQDLAQREPDLHRRRVLVLPTLGAFSAAYTTSRLSRQKASATARRCPGTGASPAPRSACPWPRISARARGRDRKTSIS